MALARWLVVLASSLAAAVVIVVIYLPTTDKCSAASQLIEDPLEALVSADPGYPPIDTSVGALEDGSIVDYIRGPCDSENWWGTVTVWLVIWGPMCGALVGAGYVSARHGGPKPFVK